MSTDVEMTDVRDQSPASAALAPVGASAPPPAPWALVPHAEPPKDEECRICILPLGRDYIRTPCNENISHSFCIECIRDWWTSHVFPIDSCPFCRTEWEWNYLGGRTTGRGARILNGPPGTRDPHDPYYDFPETLFGQLTTVWYPKDPVKDEKQPANEIFTAPCAFEPWKALLTLSKTPTQPQRRNQHVNRLPLIQVPFGQFLAALASKPTEGPEALRQWANVNDDQCWMATQAHRLIRDCLIAAINNHKSVSLDSHPILKRNLEVHFEDYFKNYFASKLWIVGGPKDGREGDDDEDDVEAEAEEEQDEEVGGLGVMAEEMYADVDPELVEHGPSDMWDSDEDGPYPYSDSEADSDNDDGNPGPQRQPPPADAGAPLRPTFDPDVKFLVTPFNISLCVYDFLLLSFWQESLDEQRQARLKESEGERVSGLLSSFRQVSLDGQPQSQLKDEREGEKGMMAWHIDVDAWPQARAAVQSHGEQVCKEIFIRCMNDVLKQLHGGRWLDQWRMGERGPGPYYTRIFGSSEAPRTHFR